MNPFYPSLVGMSSFCHRIAMNFSHRIQTKAIKDGPETTKMASRATLAHPQTTKVPAKVAMKLLGFVLAPPIDHSSYQRSD